MLHDVALQLSLCAVVLRGSAALVCREVRRSEGTFAQLHSAGAPPDGVSHNIVGVRFMACKMSRCPMAECPVGFYQY